MIQFVHYWPLEHSVICPFQVSECIRILTRHFSNERRHVGLHGLYTKYNIYSRPLATFMSMLAHLLISKSILEDANDNSDKRTYLTHSRKLFM